MKLGFVGLGKMGGNMARRLVEQGGHEVVAYDPAPSAVEAARGFGARGVASLRALVEALEPPRSIWLMVPAGPAVDGALSALADAASPGDVLVDGGNSHYKDTLRRATELESRGLALVDAGTSGGVWGLEKGYCLMVGGTQAAFRQLEPAFRTLAPENGYRHVGRTGAGHFAKMVHNAIEYGMMQAYAEGFSLLQASPFSFELGPLADLWGRGSVIRSWLLELAAKAFAEDPKLEGVAPWVDDTGYGRWSVEAAVEHAVPLPVITQSLFARFRSRQENSFADRFLATLRRQFGGHATKARSRP